MATVNAVPLFDDDGSVIGGIEIMRDIAFVDETEIGLREMAETDELTGLSRRGMFFQALRGEVARHERHGTGFRATHDRPERARSASRSSGRA